MVTIHEWTGSTATTRERTTDLLLKNLRDSGGGRNTCVSPDEEANDNINIDRMEDQDSLFILYGSKLIFREP